MKQDTEIVHAIYGRGRISQWPPTKVESHQWTGSAVWCIFYLPQTAIAACWPYMIPLSDITEEK